MSALLVTVLLPLLLTSEETSGHDRMVALLAELSQDDQHLFHGDGRARFLRKQWALMPRKSPAPQKIELLMALGQAELRLGQERLAVEAYRRAHRLAQKASEEEVRPPQRAYLAFQLGLSYLRVAETENCCSRASPESCLLPIEGEGVHTEREWSRRAITFFTEVLEAAPPKEPLSLGARWLLNLAYMTLGEYPDQVPGDWLIPPSAFAAEDELPRFANIAGRLGLDTFSLSGGTVIDDLDGDGYLDILVSAWNLDGPLQLFRSQQDGTYLECSEAAGLTGITGGLNLLQADYDNDGDIDVLVLRGAWLRAGGRHPNSLLQNQGDGTFRDVTFAAGLGEVHYPTQTAAFADYDRDGDLDLYIGNENAKEIAAPGQLFQNQGDGTFVDVAEAAGVANRRFAKGVTFGDYDDDGWPDLYVSNLNEDNRLYRNQGDGTFTDVAAELGVTGPVSSFPVWFWDFDNDGRLDLYVSAYRATIDVIAAAALSLDFDSAARGRLYRGLPDGGFADVAVERGLVRPYKPMGCNFGDLDGDGFLDFYLGTGDTDYRELMPNVMVRNLRGERFVDVTTAGGFGHLQKGHGIAFADLDHDGDHDVFAEMGGAFLGDRFHNALFENPGFGNRWVAVELVGTESNRSAIGARLRADVLEGGETRSVYRHVGSGGSFGAGPLRQTLGLGQAERLLRLEVRWPRSGQVQVLEDLPMERLIRVVEGRAEPELRELRRLTFGGD